MRGRLVDVLNHLQDEEAEAARRGEGLERGLRQAAGEIGRLEAEMARLRRKKQGREHLLAQELDNAPGQVSAHEARIAELLRAIRDEEARVPEELRSASYDPERHEVTAGLAGRHRVLELEAAGYRPRVARRAQVEADRAAVAAHLGEADAREQRITDELAGVIVESGVLEAARNTAERARGREEVARAEWADARAQLAAADEQVRMARRAVLEAFEAQAVVEATARKLSVAQWTERLLRRVLDDISAEACPRLVELMEAWMRPLLGSRFTTIDLTDDYRLRADNGSGLHEIGHFSGGEQTILAIMLRAAVSLFCRERAGFDTGFLILDEVFGDQDAQRRNALVQFLEEVKGEYNQILVISHVDEVSGQFDSILKVTPIGPNESQVELLR